MKKIFLIFFICISSFNAFCQLTYTQDLKHIAQIKFPDAPEIKSSESGTTVYVYKDVQDIYYAQVSPLEKSVKDLFTKDINNQIYNSFITGTIKSTKGKLIYKKNTLIDSLAGIEFLYTSDLLGEKKYSYNKLFFLNDTLLSFSIWATDSIKKDDKKANAYFNTFKITIPNDKIVSKNGTAIAIGLGKITAYLIFIAIPILLGFGIIFIIKKVMYRKSRT
ncbi:hypothetical protein IDJ75_04400 [Mucilaginibacter rigui]|uniref:DUF4349 domain-containing protein n=1 Tax=Mucilaginibacter rigui TaxID=534635 RepID=A0ABR7X4H0_9SPHI|nr:hypothetical protein [Mucilaginibacter rigui]MBD1384510.1 hypothetical protein [Mucilaginibacter rigui]